MNSTEPMVLLATPGMLHGGQSLAVFKQWCTDERNTLIIPGYCSSGTVGNSLLKGLREIDVDNKIVAVKCEIYNMSFSAHADSQGLVKLIKEVHPGHLMLIHGEKQKMETFAEVIEDNFKIPVSVPPNKECTEVEVEIMDEIEVSMRIHKIVREGLFMTQSMGNDYKYIIPELTFTLKVHNERLAIKELGINKPGLVQVNIKIKEGVNIEDTIKTFKATAMKY